MDTPPTPGDRRADLPRLAALALLCSLFFALAARVLNPYALPIINDEVSYLFEAELIREGHLHAPPPDSPDHYEVEWIQVDGSGWRSIYLPGWPVVLALGRLANPLILGLVVALVFDLSRRRHVAASTRVVLLGALLSPAMAVEGAFYFSHPLSALLALLTARALEDGRPGRAGFFFGWNLCVRPLTALLLAVPFLGLARRPGRFVLAGLVLPAVALAALWADAGRPEVPLYLRLATTVLAQEFTPAGAARIAAGGLVSFGLDSCPAFVWLLVLPLLATRAPERSFERRCVWAFVCLFGGHVTKAFADTGLVGTRYLFEALPFLLIGLGACLEVWVSPERARGRALVVAACSMLALIHGAVRVAHVRYVTMRFPVPHVLAQLDPTRRALVLVQETYASFYPTCFAVHFHHRGPVLFVKDLGPKRNAVVLAREAGAHVYRLVQDGVGDPARLEDLGVTGGGAAR